MAKSKVPKRYLLTDNTIATEVDVGRYQLSDGSVVTEVDFTRKICGAKLKGRNAFCRNKPTVGRDRCRFHGGHTPRGIESVHYKGNGYARHVPGSLVESFNKLISDPKILDLSEEAALVQVRIMELLGKVSVGETVGRWEQIQELIFKLRIETDEEEMSAIIDQMEAVTSLGQEDGEHWDEILDFIDQKRKITESTARVTKMRHDIITKAEAAVLVDLTQRSLREAVFRHMGTKTAEKVLHTFGVLMREVMMGPRP